MTTLEKLQRHLQTPIKIRIDTIEYKERSPKLVCADGTTMSVQASACHYCYPSNNIGPYTEVEVWKVSCPVFEFDYSNKEPSGYVDINDVVKLINNHGGFANPLKRMYYLKFKRQTK